MKTSKSNLTATRTNGHIKVEDRGAVLVAHIDGGPHALFDAALTKQLKELVDRADRDPNIHAVVFTGTHPDRFLSHSDVTWLQQGGVGFPPINTRIAGIVSRMARLINKMPIVRPLAGMTRLKTLLQLDSFHATFLKMNASGAIFVAALNGSALAVGAVDEVVPQNKVLARAIERAEYLSLRSKQSIGAIKRSIYFGSSLPLEEGLQLEHAEFLVRDQSQEAQERMLAYIAATEATGELPLLNRETYARALSTGRVGGQSD